MRTTVDLPGAICRELKALAARNGMTLKQLVRRAVERELREFTSQPPRADALHRS